MPVTHGAGVGGRLDFCIEELWSVRCRAQIARHDLVVGGQRQGKSASLPDVSRFVETQCEGVASLPPVNFLATEFNERGHLVNKQIALETRGFRTWIEVVSGVRMSPE